MTPTASSDYYAGQIQLMTVSGATDPNPSDYVPLSFDAKERQRGRRTFNCWIQNWPNTYFGGTIAISVTVSDQLLAANTWQTFKVNLRQHLPTGSPTGADVAAIVLPNDRVAMGRGSVSPGHAGDRQSDADGFTWPTRSPLASSANPSASPGPGDLHSDGDLQQASRPATRRAQVVFSYAASGPFSTNAVNVGRRHQRADLEFAGWQQWTANHGAVYSRRQLPGRRLQHVINQFVNAPTIPGGGPGEPADLHGQPGERVSRTGAGRR